MVSSFEPRWVEKGPAFRLKRAGPCTQRLHARGSVGSAAKQFAARALVPKEKAPPDDGAKDVMHGATQGSLNPSPTRSHSRANTSKLGQGITLSGMARFVQIAVVPSPGPLAVRTHGGSGRLAIPARSGSLAPWAFDDPAQSDQVTTFHSIGP